jgi:hypothetical protein
MIVVALGAAATPLQPRGLFGSALQCSAVQCSAVQCSAVQCSAVQCSALQLQQRASGAGLPHRHWRRAFRRRLQRPVRSAMSPRPSPRRHTTRCGCQAPALPRCGRHCRSRWRAARGCCALLAPHRAACGSRPSMHAASSTTSLHITAGTILRPLPSRCAHARLTWPRSATGSTLRWPPSTHDWRRTCIPAVAIERAHVNAFHHR